MINVTFEQQSRWVRAQMPQCTRTIAQLPDLHGIRLACSMHLEIKMLPWVEGVMKKGAQVFLTTCNPNTVRNEVVEYLQTQGAHAHAWCGMSAEEQSEGFKRALAWEPTHLCEMGADLTLTYSEMNSSSSQTQIKASLEATGSGIQRLEKLYEKLSKAPAYPIFNWDDVSLKEGLHNRRMVGLMTWNAFLNRTGLTLHGKRVTVIGYGSVGSGVADAAKAFGGSVTLLESQPDRALDALCAGWNVTPVQHSGESFRQRALAEADVIVTATGAENVLSSEDFEILKDGVFLINVGHHSREIDLAALKVFPHHSVLPFVEEFHFRNKKLYLFSEGSMANLVAGQGDSLNAFDFILAVMTSGLQYMIGPGASAAAGMHLLPKSAWVPNLQL